MNGRSSGAGSPFWTYENRLVAILALAGGVAGLDILALNFVAPFFVPELHMSNTQLASIGAASLLSWSLSAAAGAHLSDRLGRRKPFLVGAFVLLAVFSTASGFAQSYASLLVTRLLVGLTEGPVIPLMQSILAVESTPKRRGLNMGIAQHFGVQILGSLLAPLLLVAIATAFNWRAAFFVTGAPGLLVAALLWGLVREPMAPAGNEVARPVAPLRVRLAEILAARNVRLCLVIGALSIAAYALMLTFVPLWTIRLKGLSPRQMSIVMSTIGAAGAVSAIIVSGFADRFGRRRAIAVFTLAGSASSVALLLFANSAPAIGAGVFCASMMTGTFALFMAVVPIESVARRHSAMATAVVIGGAQLMGIAGPLLGGILSDRYSLAAPLWLMAALALLASITSWFLTETVPAQSAGEK